MIYCELQFHRIDCHDKNVSFKKIAEFPPHIGSFFFRKQQTKRKSKAFKKKRNDDTIADDEIETGKEEPSREQTSKKPVKGSGRKCKDESKKGNKTKGKRNSKEKKNQQAEKTELDKDCQKAPKIIAATKGFCKYLLDISEFYRTFHTILYFHFQRKQVLVRILMNISQDTLHRTSLL